MTYTIYIMRNITAPDTYEVLSHNDTDNRVSGTVSFIQTHEQAAKRAQEAAEYHRSNFWDMSSAARIVDLTATR